MSSQDPSKENSLLKMTIKHQVSEIRGKAYCIKAESDFDPMFLAFYR